MNLKTQYKRLFEARVSSNDAKLLAELYESLNESGVVNTGNAISQDLTNFLKEVVIPKSKGYVHDERDAAALLYDVLRHRYNLG